MGAEPPVGQLDLFEKSVRGRLMFKEQMILALQRHEVGTGNASSKLAASLEWNNEVAPHMHNQRRRLHFGNDSHVKYTKPVGCGFASASNSVSAVVMPFGSASDARMSTSPFE